MKRFLAIAMSLLLMSGLMAGRALAHAGYQDSDPKPGAVLPSAPSTVKIWFSEDLDPASTITIKAADGTVVSNGEAQVSPNNSQLLTVGLNPLGPGTYTVLWRSVAADDKGVEEDQIQFQVQGGTPAPAARLTGAVGQRTIEVEGRSSTMDVAPERNNDYTYFPVRFLAEGLGGAVTWDGANRQVSGQVLGHQFLLRIGSSTAQVDGQSVALPVPVYINAAAGRTMVPISAFSAAIGLKASIQGDDITLTDTPAH